MARNLCMDWRWLHPTAWCYWQVMDPSAGWGAIRYNASTGVAGAIETKYYVLAQFTRHIRPGMRILDVGVDRVVAGYDPAARRLVIVAFNPGAAQTLTFDLSRFSQVAGGAGGIAPRWSTVPGGSDRYTARQDIRVIDKRVSVPFATASVQTLQVDGVVI
jgi:galactan endo-1,6-beta-galactosidase